MGLLPTWKPRIGIGFQDLWNEVIDAGDNVPSGGPKGIAPTNLPDFNPNVEFIESLKHHGQPSKIMRSGDGPTELQVGPKTAGATFEMDVDPVTIAPFLISLCQQFSPGTATDYNKTIINYDRATDIDFAGKTTGTDDDDWWKAPFLMTLVRDNSIADPAQADEDMRIKDAVVRSMTISGTRGEPIKASIELVGTSIDVDFDSSGGDFTLPVDNATPLLFQDLVFKFLDIQANGAGGYTTVATDIIAFTLTITNNLAMQHYNSQDVSAFIPGRFDVSGSITIPWRNNDWIDDFLATNPILLEWLWGTITVAPSLNIALAAVFTGETTAGDEEVEIELPFTGVAYTEVPTSEEYYYPNQLNSASSLKIQVADGIKYDTP